MPDPLSPFLPMIWGGLGLFLVGVLNLLFLRRGPHVRLPITLAVLAVALVGSLQSSPFPLATAGLLLAGLIPCLLLGSRRGVAWVVFLVLALRRPGIRYGLLALVGLGLSLGAILWCETAEFALADATTADLERLHGRLPYCPCESLQATTDRGTPIHLKQSHPQDAVRFAQLEEKLLRAFSCDEQVIRRGPPDNRSNCHGWVFTGGRFPLTEEDVALILRENDYHAVTSPQPGDLVIYGSSISSNHTAIVRYVTPDQPVLIEGKWGIYGVFLHPVERSMYGTAYTYFRSSRPGHLLLGVAEPARVETTAD
jgi:hypothetical protein